MQLCLPYLLAVTAGVTAIGFQTPPPSPSSPIGTGLAMGVVVEELTDVPVAGALVTLGGSATPAPTRGAIVAPGNQVIADGQGRFVFTNLATGTYTLTATKRGYLEGALGRRRVGGPEQTLALADGERLAALKVSIWRNGAISGTIADDIGEPMVNVPVRVLARSFVAGKRRLTAAGAGAKTDDRGMYRIGALAPGEYLVMVPSTQITAPESVVNVYQSSRTTSPETYGDFSTSGSAGALYALSWEAAFRIGDLAFASSTLQGPSSTRSAVTPGPSPDGRMFVFPTLYYPASLTTTQAVSVAVTSGEEHRGVDLQLKLVPTSRISGTVRGPDGPLSVTLSLFPVAEEGASGIAIEAAMSTSDTAGRFTFLGVPFGQYRLRATKTPAGATRSGGPGPGPASQTLWTDQTITVESADIRDLTVTLRAGFRITGRADFEQTTNTVLPQTLRPGTVESADGQPLASTTLARAAFDENFNFSTFQLPDGRYILKFPSPPPGFALKGAMFSGRDIANVPVAIDRDMTGLVITFTDKPSELYGQVQNAAGVADSTATVLIVPGESMPTSTGGDPPSPLRAIRVARDGSYRVTGLQAGSYLVTAVPDEVAGDWQDPQILANLARVATKFRLAEGERKSLSLTTVMVTR